MALEKYSQTCYQSMTADIKWDLIALGYQGDEAGARYQGAILPPALCVEGRKGRGISRDSELLGRTGDVCRESRK